MGLAALVGHDADVPPDCPLSQTKFGQQTQPVTASGVIPTTPSPVIPTTPSVIPAKAGTHLTHRLALRHRWVRRYAPMRSIRIPRSNMSRQANAFEPG
jgi:hypothetical protein